MKARRTLFALLFPVCLSFAQHSLDAGIRCFEKGEFETAIITLETYLKSNPASYEAYSYLYRSYLALNRTDDGVRCLEMAIKYYPGSNEFLLALAQLEVSRGNLKKSEKLLSEVTSKTSLDTATAHVIAIVYFNLGVRSAKNKNYKEAIRYFKNSVIYDSDYENSYMNLSILLAESRQYREAQKFLKIAVKKFPDNIEFKKMLAEVCIELREYKDAQNIYEEVFGKQKDNIELGLRLALLYRYNGKIPEALGLYDYLISQNPKDRRVYEALIEYWKLFNKQDKIREVYEKMRVAFPQDETILWNIAETYEKEKKLEDARKKYMEILTLDSMSVKARLAISRTYRKEKRDSLALLEAYTVLDIDERSYDALRQIGEINIDNGKYTEALNTYRKMYSFYELLPYPLFQMGRIFYALGMPDSAIYYLNKAKELDRNNAIIYYELARVTQSAGDKEKAILNYKMALRNGIKELEKLQLKFKDGFGGKIDVDKLTEYASMKEEFAKLEDILSGSLGNLKSLLVSSEYVILIDDYLNEYPNSIFLLLERAQIHERRKEDEKALDIYEKVISINPSLPQPHLSMATIYEKMNELDGALVSYRRLLSVDNKNDLAYDGIIRIYEKRKQLGLLCEEWKALLKTQPSNELLRERLIEILHKIDRHEEARNLIETKSNQGLVR